jgi:hypothetical protein
MDQQNKEPQNNEVSTSIFDPPEADSIFRGLRKSKCVPRLALAGEGKGGGESLQESSDMSIIILVSAMRYGTWDFGLWIADMTYSLRG